MRSVYSCTYAVDNGIDYFTHPWSGMLRIILNPVKLSIPVPRRQWSLSQITTENSKSIYESGRRYGPTPNVDAVYLDKFWNKIEKQGQCEQFNVVFKYDMDAPGRHVGTIPNRFAMFDTANIRRVVRVIS
jgi:hypothetical protein